MLAAARDPDGRLRWRRQGCDRAGDHGDVDPGDDGRATGPGDGGHDARRRALRGSGSSSRASPSTASCSAARRLRSRSSSTARLRAPPARRSHRDVLPEVIERYVRTGKASLEFRGVAGDDASEARDLALASWAASAQRHGWDFLQLAYLRSLEGRRCRGRCRSRPRGSPAPSASTRSALGQRRRPAGVDDAGSRGGERRRRRTHVLVPRCSSSARERSRISRSSS